MKRLVRTKRLVAGLMVLALDVRGKVTVQTSGRIAQEEVFGVLLAILEVHGFTAVKAGNLYKILRIEGARERAVPTIVGLTPDPNRTTDEIITQIVPIRYSSVADLSALLRPLISARGTLIAHRETNVLIVTDSASNVTRLLDIRRLVGQLAVNIEGGRRVFIYYAENARAKALAATLNSIYGGRDSGATSTSRATGARAGRRRGATSPPPPPPGSGGGAPLGANAPDVLAEGQVRFIADEITNAVIVTTFPRSWTEIENTIKQLDRMPRQVLIEVLVAEITLTDDTRLGIDWAVKQGRFNFVNTNTGPPALPTTPGSDGGLMTLPAQVGGPAALIGPIGQGLTAFTFQTDKFIAMLNALASENKINIVSNPHVLTSENKKAVINVSTSVPVVTSQTTGQVAAATTAATTTSTTTTTTAGLNQTVEYRDAGVILTVTPRIAERGTVALDVKQEVNSIGPNVAPTNSPSFIKREAETSVVLVNNQTLVLGGLIQDKVTLDDRGIPLLKTIPIIGYLFGFTERRVETTELLPLITPPGIGPPIHPPRLTQRIGKSTPELDEAVRKAPRRPKMQLSPLPAKPPPPVTP